MGRRNASVLKNYHRVHLLECEEEGWKELDQCVDGASWDRIG